MPEPLGGLPFEDSVIPRAHHLVASHGRNSRPHGNAKHIHAQLPQVDGSATRGNVHFPIGFRNGAFNANATIQIGSVFATIEDFVVVSLAWVFERQERVYNLLIGRAILRVLAKFSI